MATNAPGRGTKTIGINMKIAMAKELERRAASMRLSTGQYCKIVLGDWLESGKKITLQESDKPETTTKPDKKKKRRVTGAEVRNG